MPTGPAGRAPVVLHLISSLKIGGAERLLVSTMAAARGRPDIRFVVVVMNEAVDAGLMAELRAAGHPVYHFARPQGHRHPRYMASLLRIVRQHGVEVIHAHNDGSLAWAMLARMLRPSLRLVYTQHEQGAAQRIAGLRRWVYRALVARTVAISPSVAEEFRAVAPGSVTIIENGIQLEKFAVSAERQQRGARLELVQVGRIAHVKGQDILLRAIRACVDRGLDIGCTLVGARTDETYFQSVMDLAGTLDLGDRLRFVLDRTDVETFLSGGDVFVLPSREEGFGIAIIEAMAAGLPVIVPAIGGAKDIVCDRDNGLLFEAGNPEHLAQRIAELAQDESLRLRLAGRGPATAAKFDIRRAVDQMIVLYRTISGRSMPDGNAALRSGAQGVEASALREMP